MIKLYVGWEEALLEACRNERGAGNPWSTPTMKRSVKARIKELTRMILRGEAEVIDPPACPVCRRRLAHKGPDARAEHIKTCKGKGAADAKN